MASIRRECGVCGKEIWRTPARVRPVNFCSLACRNTYWHKDKPVREEVKRRIAQTLTGRKNPRMTEMARSQVGEKHPRWKGAAATEHSGRKLAQYRYRLEPCEVCGREPGGKPRIERHHKDSNTRNNDRSNIAFLCVPCHKAAHRAMKGV